MLQVSLLPETLVIKDGNDCIYIDFSELDNSIIVISYMRFFFSANYLSLVIRKKGTYSKLFKFYMGSREGNFAIHQLSQAIEHIKSYLANKKGVPPKYPEVQVNYY